MLGITTTFESGLDKLAAAVKRTQFRNLGHAAASIRKDIIGSIEQSPADEPAPPGQPPHTRRGLIKRAEQFFVGEGEALVGAVESRIGLGAAKMEHGGDKFAESYLDKFIEPRPFVFPALERNLDRFALDWQGSLG